MHKVRQEGLPFKMTRAEISTYLIKIVHSFLYERFFSIRFENDLSAPRKLLAGVPQGSVLGPNLYTIFTHDISCISRILCTALFDVETLIWQ